MIEEEVEEEATAETEVEEMVETEEEVVAREEDEEVKKLIMIRIRLERNIEKSTIMREVLLKKLVLMIYRKSLFKKNRVMSSQNKRQ